MIDNNICCHCKDSGKLYSCRHNWYETICNHKYCLECLVKFYDEEIYKVNKMNESWICPAQRGICFCELCHIPQMMDRPKNALKNIIPLKRNFPLTKENRLAQLADDNSPISKVIEDKKIELLPEEVKTEALKTEVLELRTIDNELVKTIKDTNQSKIQGALEFNAHALIALENQKQELSKEEIEQTLITIWDNLNKLSKNADMAANNRLIKPDTTITEINYECESKKKGQGVEINLTDMIITIDKNSLIY